MYRKIMSTVFNFSIFITIGSIVITTLILYFFFTREVTNELKNQMGFLKPGVEQSGVSYLKQVSVPERITLINKNGDVLFDNYRPTPLENHLDREEVKAALNSGEGCSTRYSYTLNENTYYYASRLSNGDILRIASDQASLIQIILGFLQIYLFIILGVVIISYFVSKKLAGSLIESIDNLDPEHPLPNQSYPELDPLLFKIAGQNKKINDQLKEVKKQRADFKTITANMNEGIIIVDKNSEIKSINDSAKTLLNLDLLKAGQSIFPKLKSSELNHLIEEALGGSKGSVTLTEENRTLSIIASPIIVSKKQNGIVLIIIDITDRAQRERMRSEYIANVSHELKTPLTSISGFAEIINQGLVKPEDIGHFAGKIYDEAQHLIQIVNDILTIGYLEESNRQIQKNKTDLSLITEDIIDRLSTASQKKHLLVSLITKGDCFSKVNSEIISELLYNLVDNAIKYNNDYGRVIVFINGQNSSELVIKVIDTGIGISKENQDRIFERFYRPDKSRFKDIEGTGLGLAIVKHAALVHNAKIEVTSNFGKGSIFTLTIPRDSSF